MICKLATHYKTEYDKDKIETHNSFASYIYFVLYSQLYDFFSI